MKNKAFTLAETLVVVGLIGVVAALTLPNLGNSTGDKETVAKVNKIYAELTAAVAQAEVAYGPAKRWYQTNSYAIDGKEQAKQISGKVTSYMNVAKSCETGTGCVTSGNLHGLNNHAYGYGWNNSDTTYKYILLNGMSLIFDGQMIHVDIDGPNKGEYTFGKDLFAFRFDNETGELYPMGIDFDDAALKMNCFSGGINCTYWVLSNENLDYLKADADGKCLKTDKTLSTTVTSCK